MLIFFLIIFYDHINLYIYIDIYIFIYLYLLFKSGTATYLLGFSLDASLATIFSNV